MEKALKLYEDVMEILACAMDNKVITDDQMIYLMRCVNEAKEELETEE